MQTPSLLPLRSTRARPALSNLTPTLTLTLPLSLVVAPDVRSFHPGQVRHQPAWVQQERHVHNQINAFKDFCDARRRPRIAITRALT